MKRFILFMIAIGMMVSCTSRSGRKRAQEEVYTIPSTVEAMKPKSYPTYICVGESTAFIFHDKDDVVRIMKAYGVDSILLSRTTVIHSDPLFEDYFGEWIVPSFRMVDTTFVEVDGRDTITTIIDTQIYPAKSFRLRE